METKRGWWSITYHLEGEEVRARDLDEASLEHVGSLIAQGYREGELLIESEAEDEC